MRILKRTISTVLVLVLLAGCFAVSAWAEIPQFDIPDYSEADAKEYTTFDPDTWEIRDKEDRLYPDGIITPLEMDREERTQIIKEICREYAPNDYIAYGMLGMCDRESKCKSNAVAGQRAFSQEFTDYIDSGLEDGSTRDYFIFHCKQVSGGYGLAQWSSYNLDFNFYEFARAWGTSIGDAEMQIAFIMESTKHMELGDLWKTLQKCKNAFQAGLAFGACYDVASVPEYVGDRANYFYLQDFPKKSSHHHTTE